MKDVTELGPNKTGAQLSPDLTDAMIEGTEDFPPDVPGDATALAQARQEANAEAEPIGSVPVLGSTKGKLKSTFDKMLGHQPELLIDKLGERLAFERTGVRLYDALLAKIGNENVASSTRQQLESIRNDE